MEFRSKTWCTSEFDGDGSCQWVSHNLANAIGTCPSDPVLHDKISHRCTVEDTEPWPNPTGGYIVPGEESRWRPHILFPGTGQLAQELRIQRGGQIPGASSGQAQSNYGWRRWRNIVLYSRYHSIYLCCKNM